MPHEANETRHFYLERNNKNNKTIFFYSLLRDVTINIISVGTTQLLAEELHNASRLIIYQ